MTGGKISNSQKSFTTDRTATFYGIFSSFGITVGSHRYFSHRSFKANRALELLLILLHTMVFQYSMIKWVYYCITRIFVETNNRSFCDS